MAVRLYVGNLSGVDIRRLQIRVRTTDGLEMSLLAGRTDDGAALDLTTLGGGELLWMSIEPGDSPLSAARFHLQLDAPTTGAWDIDDLRPEWQ